MGAKDSTVLFLLLFIFFFFLRREMEMEMEAEKLRILKKREKIEREEGGLLTVINEHEMASF